MDNPEVLGELEERFIQPYRDTKAYLCPGGQREIPPGLGHVGIGPVEAPDLRRHWHRGCWTGRRKR